MENSQMNGKVFKSSRSPPSEPQRKPSKRRRLESPNKNSPQVNKNDSELKRLRTHFRAKLSHIGTSTTQLQNIRKQIQKIFELEAKKLEIEAQAGIETLEELERHLGIENTPGDSLEHQTPAEVDISPIKSPMKQRLLELLPEDTRLKKNILFSGFGGSPTSLNTQKSSPGVQKTPKDLFNKTAITPGPQCHQKTQSQECMVKIHRLNTEQILWEERKALQAKAARVDDLEKELKSSKDTISSLRKSLKNKMILEQQVAGLRKALELAETREQKLNSRCEELSSRVEDYEARSSGGNGGQRSQLVESRLITESGKLRCEVEILKRENEELRRKFEGDQKKGLVRAEVSLKGPGDGDGEKCSIDDDEETIDVVGDDSVEDKPVVRNSAVGISSSDRSDGVKEEKNTAEPRGESKEKRTISIGHHQLLPSSQSYFDIDFEAEYVQKNGSKFVCRTCEGTYNTKPKIIDHLWSAHHSGRWLCSQCSQTNRDRYSLVMHMRTKHPDQK